MMAESIADRLRALEPRLRDNYYRLGAIDELYELAAEVERLEQHHAALHDACQAAYDWMYGVWGKSDMVMGIERHPIRLLMLRLEAALRGDGGGCHGQ